jgi:DNA-binding response OmpR family regulator
MIRRMESFSVHAGPTEDEGPLALGELLIVPSERRVEVDGTPVELTAREFDLLEFFARHPGRVFTRSQLLDHVWGYAHDGYEHTVNTHINRLRGKIEVDPANPRFILTVWGVGYKLPRERDLEPAGRC